MNLGLELLLEAAVIAALVWQAARIATKPVVRRELAAHPAAVAAVMAALAALGLLAWAPSESALLRRGPVALSAAALLVAGWRARPAYGVRNGLAPGSIGFGAGLDGIDDRDFYRCEAERHGPVFKSSQFGRPILCIVGLDRGRELLLRHEQHLEAATLPYARLIPKGALRFMEKEDHRQLAGLFRPSIAAADLAGTEAAARRAFRAELLRLADECARRPSTGGAPGAGGGPGGGVQIGDASGRALFVCLARILLGLDAGSPELEEIRVRMDAVDFRGSGRAWRRRAEAELDRVTEILRCAARDASAPIAAASALGRILAAEPGALEDRTITANLILIFRMAQTDMTGLLVWIAKMLSDDPAWRAHMRTQGRTSGPPPTGQLDLGTRIVMETLRLEQSEYLYRKAADTFEFGGYRVPKGWLIRICVQESHRSPEIFENPTRFDPDRFAAGGPGRNEYAPLGMDAHACMGTAIIHFLGRIFVEELTLGFDWEVVSDGPPERGPRHWLHWRPSSRFRLALRVAA